MEKVFLKEAVSPNDVNAGIMNLASYGKSKMPGTSDYITPNKDPKSRRWLTGLDEYATSILSIQNSEERKKQQDKIKAERLELESLTGMDLDAKNDEVWASFLIKLKNLVLDPTNPVDRIKLRVCEANGYVAPNQSSVLDPEYYKAKYYLGREFEEVDQKLKVKREYNKAAAALIQLMNDEQKARLVCKFLRLNTSESMPKNNIEEVLQQHIDNKLTNLEHFANVCAMSNEDLMVKVSFDEAVKRGVIRLTNGLFQRGSITYGKNESEALGFLLLPSNAGELASVLSELEEKRKFS